MIPQHIKALGVGAVLIGLSAGAAFAAVATTDVNVRSGPGTRYPVISGLSEGQYASVVRESGGWCYVNKAGTDGWVSCAYLAGSGEPTYTRPHIYGPDIYLNFDYGPRFPYQHRMRLPPHHSQGPGLYPHPMPHNPGPWPRHR